MKSIFPIILFSLFVTVTAKALTISGPTEFTIKQGADLRDGDQKNPADLYLSELTDDIIWTVISAPNWFVPDSTNNDMYYLEGIPTEPGEYEIKLQASAGGETSGVYTIVVHVLSSAPELGEPSKTQVYQTKFVKTNVYVLNDIAVSIKILNPPKPMDIEGYETTVTGLPDGAIWAYSPFDGQLIEIRSPWLEVGVYPISVTHSNIAGSDTVQFDLEVLSGKPTIDAVQSAIELDIGEPFKRAITYTGAGSMADNTEIELIGNLPRGMEAYSFAEDQTTLMTYRIEGTPTEEGVFPLTVIVRNDYGEDSKDFTIYVGVKAPGEQTIAHIALGPDMVEFLPGFAYSQWFGFVFTANAPWVYNYELGWFYIFEGTTSYDDVWMYHVGNPGMGWMYGGSAYDGFFYYEITPGNWGWQWLYTGAVDFSIPDDPPANQ